ncbi:DUF2478 domain-containing protein [Cognatishimia activa]|uniref:DUF2478 domain-containing protein n=1 Tax=Cognatishimia activa TaxID=1715691 RepID=UPI00222EB528|nr:DUF2478 domain-containing protein [Cognatishimia activa]UZD90004.1 DUF2478 domain-containing protein [Cognatishimia activa]
MKLGYVMMDDPRVLDTTLACVAQDLLEKGLRVSGVVQINTEREKDHKCDMDVKVLPEGPTICISQSLGAGSTGCRLNPEALETAVELVAKELETGSDVLLINKFGKHEAEGRGFRELIGTALSREIPVLVGLNGLNKAAFQEFAGNLETHVDAGQALEWVNS